MPEKILPKKFLETFPEHRGMDVDPMEFIANDILERDYKVIALDDDPTGTQTVHDVEIITDWSGDSILDVFRSEAPLFYILTNSRSLSPGETSRVHTEIAENISAGSRKTGKKFVLISRSDSTLRGHYPLEMDVLRSAFRDVAGLEFTHEILIPAFFEGGRYTFNDVHWVTRKNHLIPTGKTEFANDHFFGYEHSNLIKWVKEKRGWSDEYGNIFSFSVEDLRSNNVEWIKDVLVKHANHIVVVNAIDYRDLEKFTTGCILAEKEGIRPFFRTAASFVRVRGGIRPKPILEGVDILSGGKFNHIRNGIIVAGSVVHKTTGQINCLLENEDHALPVVLNVRKLLDSYEDDVNRCVRSALEIACTNKSPLLYTSREIIRSENKGIRINRIISRGLVDVVKKMIGGGIRFKYIITKGGITSSDIATEALKIRRALVIGEIFPGIPVWKAIAPEEYENLPLIIFPGNVGRNDTLLKIYRKLDF